MTDAEMIAATDSVLPSDIRVFVNERGVSIPRESSALDAVRAYSEADATDLAAGRARLTDSRGLPMMPDAIVHGGAIMRVLPVRDKSTDSQAPEVSA
ncbi:MAG: hypothetical protein M3Y64_07690 [Gemmatimonadota bacterium]|nr:hypothetical protein [Gemmatimonadota bacterium]